MVDMPCCQLVSVQSFVKSLGQPELLDLLVNPSESEDVTMEDAEDLRPAKRKVVYPEVFYAVIMLPLFSLFLFTNLFDSSYSLLLMQHKPMSEITSGLHRGIYHQGKLRVNRYNPFEAYVGSESIGDEIIIYGRGNMNRAFDGDIVAVELLPQDEWHEENKLSIAEEGL